MGLLTAALVTTESRAENAYKLLLAAASVSAFIAVVQFGLYEAVYFQTGDQAADPTLIKSQVNFKRASVSKWETYSRGGLKLGYQDRCSIRKAFPSG